MNSNKPKFIYDHRCWLMINFKIELETMSAEMAQLKNRNDVLRRELSVISSESDELLKRIESFTNLTESINIGEKNYERKN